MHSIFGERQKLGEEGIEWWAHETFSQEFLLLAHKLIFTSENVKCQTDQKTKVGQKSGERGFGPYGTVSFKIRH